MSLHDLLDGAIAAGRPALDEATGKAVLASFGIAVPAHRAVRTDEALRDAAAELRPPFALKVLSHAGIHKSDVGGVTLGLRNAEEVMASRETMQGGLGAHGIEADGWLLEEMVSPGVEMVVGGVVDPQFGPMVMVGLGGVFIEILKDVAVRICPIERRDAIEMIEGLRGAPLLKGARGRPKVAVEAVVDVLMKVGGADGLLMQAAHHIAELDINPLIANPDGAFAVDARFILRSAAAGGELR